MSKDTNKSLDTSKTDLDSHQRPTRVPLHRQRQELIRTEEGWFYYGFPNTKYWIERALKAGYEFCTEDDASVDTGNMSYANTSSKKHITVVANPRLRDETPYAAREIVFMRIPEHLHNQDLADAALEVDEQESRMTPATSAKSGLGMYQDYQRKLR